MLANIESSVLEQISDYVANPPHINKYNGLKDRLIKEFTDSEERKLKMLLTELDLGDKRPSALLRQMRELSNERLTGLFYN